MRRSPVAKTPVVKRAKATPARGKRTPDAGLHELRRKQIIAAARALVSEEGIEALTISGLESRVHFSRGVITYHFADKDEIVEALLQSAVAEIDADTEVRLRKSGTLEEKVLQVFASKARGFLERREASAVLIALWGRAGRDERARRVHAALFARYRGQAASLARLAQRERPEVQLDAAAFGALFVGAVIGLAVQAILQPDAFALDAAIGEAARAFTARLRGA
jgi:TetR/AcrR family fatty acid metabolism transcriptional regulator